MHKAALRNHLGIMISLSPEGAEIGAVTDAHQSPHHLAANKGCVEAVITLQNAKTDFKVRGRLIRTLLYSSVAAHQMSVVNCLLGRATHRGRVEYLSTATHCIFGKGFRPGILRGIFLIETADIEARDENWRISILIALMGGDNGVRESITSLLFSKGQIIEARTTLGMTLLDLRTHRFGPTKRCFLLSKEAAPTAKDNDRDTYLDLTICLFYLMKRKSLKTGEIGWALNH